MSEEENNNFLPDLGDETLSQLFTPKPQLPSLNNSFCQGPVIAQNENVTVLSNSYPAQTHFAFTTDNDIVPVVQKNSETIFEQNWSELEVGSFVELQTTKNPMLGGYQPTAGTTCYVEEQFMDQSLLLNDFDSLNLDNQSADSIYCINDGSEQMFCNDNDAIVTGEVDSQTFEMLSNSSGYYSNDTVKVRKKNY
jgi:hypothetical protein